MAVTVSGAPPGESETAVALARIAGRARAFSEFFPRFSQIISEMERPGIKNLFFSSEKSPAALFCGCVHT